MTERQRFLLVVLRMLEETTIPGRADKTRNVLPLFGRAREKIMPIPVGKTRKRLEGLFSPFLSYPADDPCDLILINDLQWLADNGFVESLGNPRLTG